MVLTYDGTRYDGWQKQGNTDNTIQGKLETLLGKVLGEEIEIQGSGRTDAGVHAYGQVANFHTSSQKTLEEIEGAMNHYLPMDIGIVSLEEVDNRFHSRLHAKEKIYRYRIWNSSIHNVFERKYIYVYEQTLSITAMQKAAMQLVGTYDFKSFCSNKRMKKSTIRDLKEIQIEKTGEEIQIIYRGNGFLYNMVRILTGTLIEVGNGTRNAEEIKEVLKAENREAAGFTAPPQGLFLQKVIY